MKRYRLRQGKLRPDDQGDWVSAEEAKAEINRLRNLYRQARRAHFYCNHGAKSHFGTDEWLAETEHNLEAAGEK